MSTSRRVDSRGFTIVELLIVIVVIAILAAIAIVAYRGVTQQARTSAMLASLDAAEKAIRLTKELQGGGFYGNTVTYNPAELSSNHGTIPAARTLSTGNVFGGVEYFAPKCIPGDYPAKGVFREGECFVNLQEFIPDGGGEALIVTRQAFTVADWLAESVKSAGVAVLNASVSGDEAVQTYAVESENYNGALLGLGTGTVRYRIQYRGAYVTVNTTDVGTVTYFHDLPLRFQAEPITTTLSAVPTSIVFLQNGDKKCGRGVKVLSGLSDQDVRAYQVFAYGTDDEIKQLYRDMYAETYEGDFEADLALADFNQVRTMYSSILAAHFNGNGGQYSTTTCTINLQ